MTWDTLGSTAFMVALPLLAAAAVALAARGKVAPWPTIALVVWLVGSGLWAVAVAGSPLGTGGASCDSTMVELRSSGQAGCVDPARTQFLLATVAYLALTALAAHFLTRRPRTEDGDGGSGVLHGAGTGSMRQQFHNK